jgi:integrative and conjugative element protein (TIGR02256 family)
MSRITFSLQQSVKAKLTAALNRYGDFEIGGILIGKKVGEDNFEIVDASISDEDKRFSLTSFIRGTKKSQRLLKQHFRNGTGYYIGEWHSHPRFSLDPSLADIRTMMGILHDPSYGVSFAILLIIHISEGEIKHKGLFFHRDLSEIVPLE